MPLRIARSSLILLPFVALACGQPTINPLPDAAVEVADMKVVRDLTAPPCVAGDGGACVSNVTVKGQVLDTVGAPIKDMVTSLCAEICFFGKTDNLGRFTMVTGNQAIDFGRYAVLLHGQPHLTTYYIRPPAPVQGVSSFPDPLVILQATTDGPPIAMDKSAQTLTLGDVTLTLTAGTDVLLTVEDVAEGELGSKFRPLTVTPVTLVPFVDSSAPPEALFAFSPFEVVFTLPARVTVANTASLPANQAVEFLGMRGLVTGSVVGMPPAGGWAVVATGKVSSDGTKIDMDQGQGVTGLTWLAIRKAN